ncbi:hypothetical protein KQH65_11645 [archaeon]|nr:hypothetical protein [archaeon]
MSSESTSNNRGYQLYLKGRRAEEFVQELGKKTFLEDWCYNNPLLPNSKELCDFLIVFDDIAIIWQVKDLKLNKDGKYKESQVRKNIRQAVTAGNRILNNRFTIELTNPRRGCEKLDSNSIKRVFYISALLGEGEDYFNLVEIYKKKIIHTFTREFTEIILSELDTIKDFIDYLEKKEELLSHNTNIVITGGEEELLGYYLLNERKFDSLFDLDVIILEEGIWKDLQKREQYQRKKAEDYISYGWDSIINTAHTSGLPEYIEIARELARFDRFHRRALSKAFFEAHKQAHIQSEKNSFRRIIQADTTTIVFLFYDDPEPRQFRRSLLGLCCFVARGIFKENTKVIGIATEMKIAPLASYDFCRIDLPVWNDEHQKQMLQLQNEFGIFSNYKTQRMHEDEYPLE